MSQKTASDNAEKSASIAANHDSIDEAAIISLLFDQYGRIVDTPPTPSKRPSSSTPSVRWAERALSINWDAVLSQPRQTPLPMSSDGAHAIATNARKTALKRIKAAKQTNTQQRGQTASKSAHTHAEQQSLPLAPRASRFATIPLAVNLHGEPIRRLSREEEADLILRAQRGDVVAQEVLIMAMRRILRMCAYRVRRQIPNSTIDELMQDGVIGVHRAIQKFDVTKGLRLATYASIWANSVMHRGSVERAKEETPWNHLDTESDEDGEKRLKSYRMESIDHPCDGDAFALRDTIADNDEETVESRAIANERRNLMRKALERMTDERMIIVARLRWLSENPATLERIATLLQMSREGVRQIEVKALHQLKQILMGMSSDSFAKDAASKRPQSPSGRRPTGKKKPAASSEMENEGDACI